MGITEQGDEGLFAGGPCVAWQKALRLIRSPTEQRTTRVIGAAVLLGWLPLVILAGAAFLLGSPTARSFFSDVAVHARFLIALPALILGETDLIPRFGRIAGHFLASGLVGPNAKARYDHVIASTRRLLEARTANFVTLLLAYAAVIALLAMIEHGDTPEWYWSGPGRFALSTPGLWHAFVSLPLLLWLCFGWLWRLLLWWRFLASMARLELRLIPMHPDGAGGVKFVSSSIRGYRMLAFSIGVIVAAAHINLSLRTGETGFGFRNAAIAVAALFVTLAAGPLVMFTSKLRETRVRGTFRYGTLARELGSEFERQWLGPPQPPNVDAETLKVQDFSAMTDLNSAVANVYKVTDIPFNWKDLKPVVVAALVPFIPLVLMAVPVADLLLQAVKTLLL